MRQVGVSHSVSPGSVGRVMVRGCSTPIMLPSKAFDGLGIDGCDTGSYAGAASAPVSDVPIDRFLSEISPDLESYAHCFKLAGVATSAPLLAKAAVCAIGGAGDEFKEYLKRIGVSRIGHRQKIWQSCNRE